VKETLEDKLVEVPRLILALEGRAGSTHDEEPQAMCWVQVLGSGRTSPLYKALVFDKQLASGVSASNNTLGLGGWFQITVTPPMVMASTRSAGRGADPVGSPKQRPLNRK